MKKLLFAVTALAALSLLAPSTGFADGSYNQIGFYTDEAMTSVNAVADAPYATVPVYVVLTNPHNGTDRLADIGGYEFGYVAGADLTVLSMTFSSDGIDVGAAGNHIVGLGAPLVVGDDFSVLLGTMSVLYGVTDGSAREFHLAVTDPASIPGTMAIIWGPSGTLQAVYPSSGSYDDPVFSINGDVVATENIHMDEIKAMYR